MEEALRAHILAMAGMSAIVVDRVDWGVRPDGDPLPAVCLHRLGGAPTTNAASAGAWQRIRVQAETWGRTAKASRDAADIIAKLHCRRGPLGTGQARTFVIDRATDADSKDSQGIVHRTRLDLIIWWKP